MVRYHEIINEIDSKPDEKSKKSIFFNPKTKRWLKIDRYIETDGEIIFNENTGRFDATGNITVKKTLDGKIPIPFGEVMGRFICNALGLLTLENAPINVGNDFQCWSNKLTSLEHVPAKIPGNFGCQFNKLISLEHTPIYVGGDYQCEQNQLTSLEHAPANVTGMFSCSDNQLKSLKYAPTNVRTTFSCGDNPLESLEYAPTKIGGIFYCGNIPTLVSLKGIEYNSHIKGELRIDYSPKLPLLRLLVVRTRIAFYNGGAEIERILNQHIETYPNLKERLVKCQYELIKSGFKGNAKW